MTQPTNNKLPFMFETTNLSGESMPSESDDDASAYDANESGEQITPENPTCGTPSTPSCV